MESRISSQEILPNIYWTTKGNKKLLYAPLKDKVVTGFFRSQLAKKIITLFPDIHKPPEVIPLPTTVTLDLIHACSLNCVYCSVDSDPVGSIQKTRQEREIMPVEIAQAAINLVFRNAQKMNVSQVGIVFGGGGEPSLAWETLTEAIDHTWRCAQKYRINPEILVATGGVLSKRKIRWLADRTTHIALSFDGPSQVQNTQRPLGGKGLDSTESFCYAKRSAEVLYNIRADFSIRAAISELNADLTELVIFFSQFKPKLLNFQPVVVCGRCYQTGWQGLEPDRFIKEFKKAYLVAKEKEVPLLFPGARIDRIIPEVCHAYNGTGFVVTNRGYVSACERVLDGNDDLSDLFIYGKYREREFQFNKQQLNNLQHLQVEKIDYCKNCFCRWHCGGGCLNEHLSQPQNKNDPFCRRSHPMCYITREIAWYLLQQKAS